MRLIWQFLIEKNCSGKNNVLTNFNIQALQFFTIYPPDNCHEDQFLNLVIEKTLFTLAHFQYINSLILLLLF
jgi:hypothetical protein